MIYREIGKTGLQASIIGLGAEHLENRPYSEVEEVVEAALENGINIMDVFMAEPIVRKNLAKALKGRRKDVLLQGHIGSCLQDGQFLRTRDLDSCKRYFENFLECFQTDYVDFGMMFYIDSEKDFRDSFETDYVKYVLKLKEQGVIKHIGASSHNPVTAAKIVRTGLIELLLFSINPAYDMKALDFDIDPSIQADKSGLVGIEPARANLYELCESKNIGITVMKTLCAGRLLSPKDTPFEKPMTVGQCIHYALSRPAVVSTLIGCRSHKEVEEACHYLQLTEEEKDFSFISKSLGGELNGKCMYCNHCLPCPSKIDIAALTKLLDIAALNPKDIPPSILSHYKDLEGHGLDCIQCGSCESNCPFGVEIIKNMEHANIVFGF